MIGKTQWSLKSRFMEHKRHSSTTSEESENPYTLGQNSNPQTRTGDTTTSLLFGTPFLSLRPMTED